MHGIGIACGRNFSCNVTFLKHFSGDLKFEKNMENDQKFKLTVLEQNGLKKMRMLNKGKLSRCRFIKTTLVPKNKCRQAYKVYFSIFKNSLPVTREVRECVIS